MYARIFRSINTRIVLSTHSAPPVVYPLGRSRFQAGFLICLWLAGCAALCLWFYSGEITLWRMLSMAAMIVLAGVIAVLGWKKTPAGQLRWDGQVWHWESDSCQDNAFEWHLSVVVDFQYLLLLRMESQMHSSICLWCDRHAFAPLWLDFRRAIFSPGRWTDGVSPEAVLGHAETAAPRQINR